MSFCFLGYSVQTRSLSIEWNAHHTCDRLTQIKKKFTMPENEMLSCPQHQRPKYYKNCRFRNLDSEPRIFTAQVKFNQNRVNLGHFAIFALTFSYIDFVELYNSFTTIFVLLNVVDDKLPLDLSPHKHKIFYDYFFHIILLPTRGEHCFWLCQVRLYQDRFGKVRLGQVWQAVFLLRFSIDLKKMR